jgi:hypothetical protein
MASRKKITYLGFLLFALLAMQTGLFAQEQYDTVKSVNDPDETVLADTLSSVQESNDDRYLNKTPKGDFRNIYDTSISIHPQKKVPDSLMKKILDDDDFWYANKVEEQEKEKKKEKKEEESNNDFLQSDAANFLFWTVLVLLMLGAIIVYLKDNQINLFSSRSKKMKQDAMDDGSMPENIFEIEYASAISKALAANNYRLATRFLFLQTLKTLSSKKIIDYAADKTNFDYLFQINGTKYYPLFMQVARNYEYLWYGKFEVNEQQFIAIRKSFDEFHKQIA